MWWAGRDRDRGEKKEKRVLKYFSPPPATQTRPRVPVSSHASTVHLFSGGGGGEWKRRYEEDGAKERDHLWLRMVSHLACSMSGLLLLEGLYWPLCERNDEEQRLILHDSQETDHFEQLYHYNYLFWLSNLWGKQLFLEHLPFFVAFIVLLKLCTWQK